MVNSIKRSIGGIILKNKLKRLKRNRRVVNLNDAGTVAILYALNDQGTYNIISEFVGSLQQQNKKVKALGLVQHKSDTENFLPKLSYDFIYHKDINWFGKPSGVYTEEFLNTDYDILIDVSNDMDYTSEYLFVLSIAKLKVGYSDNSDVIIERDEKKGLKEYLENISHYLSILKRA